MNCISAHAVPNKPYISAARAALPPTKFCTSMGSTGMIMPNASMSMSTVTNMKVNAALRRGSEGIFMPGRLLSMFKPYRSLRGHIRLYNTARSRNLRLNVRSHRYAANSTVPAGIGPGGVASAMRTHRFLSPGGFSRLDRDDLQSHLRAAAGERTPLLGQSIRTQLRRNYPGKSAQGGHR